MHPVFGEEAVLALHTKVVTSIKKNHPIPNPFGAMAMMKWLKDNLTSQEIDLLAVLEEKAGEAEATQWLFEALSSGDEAPTAAA